ncbi:hypothetical protein SSCG_00278 [Streptomyces clavuligerus]|nr:hypothetical protein SSCG_00278 [Streptomyces clavuligerus]
MSRTCAQSRSLERSTGGPPGMRAPESRLFHPGSPPRPPGLRAEGDWSTRPRTRPPPAPPSTTGEGLRVGADRAEPVLA